MLKLLCHVPHIPSDIPSSSSSFSSSPRVNKRKIAGNAVSAGRPSTSSGGDESQFTLSRHNTLKKRRHFSLSSGRLLRSASTSSRAPTPSIQPETRCVSVTAMATSKNISAPSAFRHHFHLGVEIFDDTPRDTSAWEESKWREIIESQMNEQKQQQHPKAESKMNVASSSSSSSTSSSSASSHSSGFPQRTDSPAPTSILCPSPTPDSLEFGTMAPPPSSVRPQKRSSLVRRKPVPKLCPEELGELAALAASASPSGSCVHLPTSYVLVPAPLPEPIEERKVEEQEQEQGSPRPPSSLSSIESDSLRTSESESDSGVSSELPATPEDARSLNSEDNEVDGIGRLKCASASVIDVTTTAVTTTRPKRISLPLPALPLEAIVPSVTPSPTPPVVPARNKKRLSAQNMMNPTGRTTSV